MNGRISMREALLNSNYYFDSVRSNYRLNIPWGFYTPGFWVVCATNAKRLSLSREECHIDQNNLGYAKAIGFESVWGEDTYSYQRKAAGSNYSILSPLHCAENLEKSVESINNCLRRFLNDSSADDFKSDLYDIVGELHSNVESHALGEGYSMAQKWPVPGNNSDSYLEVAIADCGLGLLRETKRVNIEGINNDEDAILWCVQEGYSTKIRRNEDGWAQRVPEDIAHNPLSGISTAQNSGSHHQGLGLYKFVNLVNKFNGFARLATGDRIYCLDPEKSPFFITSPNNWRGFAVECRFQLSKIPTQISEPELIDFDEFIESID